jgi:hypothetical protein
MGTRLKNIASLVALILFCVLAAGSIDSGNGATSENLKKLSVDDQLKHMSSKDVAFALNCTANEGTEYANPIDVISVYETKDRKAGEMDLDTLIVGFMSGQISPSDMGIQMDHSVETNQVSYYFMPEILLYDYGDESKLAHDAKDTGTNYDINRNTLKMDVVHARSDFDPIGHMIYSCTVMNAQEAQPLIDRSRNVIVPILEAKKRSEDERKQDETNGHKF